MLVLSRVAESGESINLYDATTKKLIATICAVAVKGRTVKIGISAGMNTLIYRDEIDPLKPQSLPPVQSTLGS